jgi:hypothetical protein
LCRVWHCGAGMFMVAASDGSRAFQLYCTTLVSCRIAEVECLSSTVLHTQCSMLLHVCLTYVVCFALPDAACLLQAFMEVTMEVTLGGKHQGKGMIYGKVHKC